LRGGSGILRETGPAPCNPRQQLYRSSARISCAFFMKAMVWLKSKNPASEAARRERDEEWR
jgi:hypothetical protein